MSPKVLTPRCIKCGTTTLTGTHANVSLQIGPTNEQGLYKEYMRLACIVCEKCLDKYGIPKIIRRIPGQQDVGIFSKDQITPIELYSRTP